MRGAAGVVALQHLPPALASPQFAYVASGTGSLHVFAVRGDAWERIQCVPSLAPACLLLSSDQRTLYVANEVDEHERLPRGTVEVFRVGPVDGRLTLLERRALSLSATRPRHMALSPNGKLLAVAAYGGGIYNLLPIAEDGGLGEPAGIFKDAGSGIHPQLQASAHPHSLVFDATGLHLLSSDFGSDRVSVFAVKDGRLVRRMRKSTGEGSGPGMFALADSVLYVWHHLESTLAVYRYDGGVGETLQRFPLTASPVQALALHPSGRMLFTAYQGGLTTWHISEHGMLVQPKNLASGEGPFAHITVASGGESIYLLGRSICLVTPDRQARVAVVQEPRSMVLLKKGDFG